MTGVRTVIEKAGAELRYLPPYSPDFDPIEMASPNARPFLKKTAPCAAKTLWNANAGAIPLYTPEECQNYFVAAGYDCD